MGNIYVGDANNIARKVKGIYVGDANGIARKVLKGYVGDANGVAQEFYSSGISPIRGSFSHSYVVPQNKSTTTIDWGTYLASASDYASKLAQGATNFELTVTVTIQAAQNDEFQLVIAQYNKATMPQYTADVSQINTNSYGLTSGFLTGVTKTIQYTKPIANMSNGLAFALATNDYWGDTITVNGNYEIRFT